MKKTKHASLILTLALLLYSNLTWGTSVEGIWANKKGVGFLAAELPEQSVKKFNEALMHDPFNSIYKLNLGVTQEVLEEVEKAKKLYEITLGDKLAHPEARFAAAFNLGRLAAAGGNIPEALGFYQSALDFKPDSIEAKTNIELLWQGSQNNKDGKGKGKPKDDKNSKGGSGQDKDQKDPKDGDQNEQQQAQNPKPEKQDENKKKKPKEFKSKELTKADVRKILNELKKQEQQIREKEFGQKVKEKALGKDW